jgi:hypothetical protein
MDWGAFIIPFFKAVIVITIVVVLAMVGCAFYAGAHHG